MSVLEQEIMEELKTLDESAKQRVLAVIRESARAQTPRLTAEAWREHLERLWAQSRPKPASASVTAQSMLDEVREEESWPFPE